MIIEWPNARKVVAFSQDVTLAVGKLFPVYQWHCTLRNGMKELKKLVASPGRGHAYATRSPLNIYKNASLLDANKRKLRNARHDKDLLTTWLPCWPNH